jgi:hypothetical protein
MSLLVGYAVTRAFRFLARQAVLVQALALTVNVDQMAIMHQPNSRSDLGNDVLSGMGPISWQHPYVHSHPCESRFKTCCRI